MADTIHLIDNIEFNPPDDWQLLEITVDWLEKKETGGVPSQSDLTFSGEAAQYLNERFLNGTTGGVGLFEGVDYKIKVGSETSHVYIFEGYLDGSDDITIFGKERITVKLKKVDGSDWLNDVADGFSFAFLKGENIITDSDYIKIPYVINYVPDGTQLALLSVSLFMMTKELIENIYAISEIIGDITDAATPGTATVVGVGISGVVVSYGVSFDLGNFILVALKTIARIVYIIGIIIAITNLIESIFEQLLPKKRHHLGMKLRTMFERSCEHLGLGFESDIEDLDVVYMPRKDRKGGESGESGHPTNGGVMYTFGDFMRIMIEMFNADYRIQNGVLIFKRRDKFEISSGYVIPEFFNNQERLLDQHGFNSSEMVSNYNILYQYDIQDQNTLDDQSGRVFQAITTPIVVNNQKLVTIKNIAQVSLPFSLGKDKTGLTAFESLAKGLGSVVDAITGIFGGGTNFESQIQERVGSLMLSSHFTTYGKLIKMNGSKLAGNQRSYLDASVIWDKYHFINSFAEYKGVHNQYYRYPAQKVPIPIEDFAVLLENNITTDSQGRDVLIETVLYNPSSETGIITYRVRQKYTDNLQINTY